MPTESCCCALSMTLCNRVCLLNEKKEVTELLVVLREQLSDLLARIDFYSSW